MSDSETHCFDHHMDLGSLAVHCSEVGTNVGVPLRAGPGGYLYSENSQDLDCDNEVHLYLSPQTVLHWGSIPGRPHLFVDACDCDGQEHRYEHNFFDRSDIRTAFPSTITNELVDRICGSACTYRVGSFMSFQMLCLREGSIAPGMLTHQVHE